MNPELGLPSGGILRSLSHVLKGKCFHLIVKKKKNQSLSEFRFSWQHILRLKTILHYCKTSRGAITKGSVFDHQPRENKINRANKLYAPGLDPCASLLRSLCWTYICIPEFLTTALMTMRPLLTHPVSRLPISFKCLFEAYQSHFSHCPFNFPFK